MEDELKKLGADELKELQLWQKRMIIVFAITMVCLPVVVVTDLIIVFSRTEAWLVFLVLLALVVLSGFIQFSQRCPRYSYRLGFQSRLLVPDNCKRCDVGLK